VITISERYGWERLFLVLAATAFLAGLVLLPLWNLKGSSEASRCFHEPAMQETI
jgi:sugar phosphate permease